MNNRPIRFAVVLALGAMAALCFTGCRESPQKLDRYVTAAQQVWGFQGAVLVAHDGKAILSKGYGLADQVFGDPNTPHTKFFIGSITKQFTAAAVLLLQQDGRLNVHDPISTYLPDWRRDTGDKITIHHLLTHTSGIPNYTDVPEIVLKRTSRISPAELMATFQDWPLEFEPGSDFSYSNSNYIILGAIIEKISGQSYEAFLHHRLLKPVGMFNSGYARREVGLPQRAEGYSLDEQWKLVDAVPVHMSVLHTAGALYSTVEDMLQWDQELYVHKILSVTSVEAMLTPNKGSYGYGWIIDTLYGRLHTFHGGFLDGFNTTFERWPDEKLCVVVFSNEDEAPVKKMARSLAAICFDHPYDFPVKKTPGEIDPRILADYQGVYQVGQGNYRFVTLQNDSLYTYVKNEPPVQLLPEAIDTFFFESDNTMSLIFTRDTDGTVIGHTLINERRAITADKLTDEEAERLLLVRTSISLDPNIYDQYTGVYELVSQFESGGADFNLTVARRGNCLFMAAPNADEVEIFPRSASEFYHKTADFGLTFVKDDSDRVTGCILHMGDAEVHGKKIK